MEDADFENLIRRALAEDFAHEDITSLACVPENQRAHAQLLLKQNGTLCGLKFLPQILRFQDPTLSIHLYAEDGQALVAGSVLAEVIGSARSILAVERTLLNFLQHLSGVATLTARAVAKTKGTNCQILDTRKTILGLRLLQKYAVRCGGGTNHRLHLADRILIKDNHLTLASKNTPSPLFFCVQSARALHPQGWIEVEISSPSQLEIALDAGADALLLDNMTVLEVAECARINRTRASRATLEASGGITLDNLASYAAHVDAVSIGALTHSAPALDISLKIKP